MTGSFFDVCVTEKQLMFNAFKQLTYAAERPEGMKILRWLLSDKQKAI